MKNAIGFLRTIKKDEIELMLSWRNHPSIRMNMYNQHEIRREEHLKWWDKASASEYDQYFMYELNEIPTGIIGFNNIDKNNKNASWAFYASPNATKGSGTKMEFLALEYAFNTLSLHKLYCEVLAFNTSVIKMHKKFGFLEEGVFREQYLKHEQFIDIYRLGILKNEWLLNRNAIKKKIDSFR